MQSDAVFANGAKPPYDKAMEARVAKLESDLTGIRADLAAIKEHGATKSHLVALRADFRTQHIELRSEFQTLCRAAR